MTIHRIDLTQRAGGELWITSGMKTVLYPGKDIAACQVALRQVFGVSPSMDEVFYVEFDVDGQHVGLDPNGHSKGMTGTDRRSSGRRQSRCSTRSAASESG